MHPERPTQEAAAVTVAVVPVCGWCGRPFRPQRTGGRRFCRPKRRRDYHDAARAWTLDAVSAGVLSLAAVKTGFTATCAFAGGTAAVALEFEGVGELEPQGASADGGASDHV